MKTVIIIALAVMFCFQPPKASKSQFVESKKTDTSLKDYQQSISELDSAKTISNNIEMKLSKIGKKKEVVYRTKIIIKHIPKIVHDTVLVAGTKYVSVPTKDYYFKSMQHYNDSLKAHNESLYIEHSFFYKIFHHKKQKQ